jgi:glycosyltransferase involved in cell wall biosynthesis
MGKVVLGGNGQGNAQSLGEEVSPVIHINPDENDVYVKLKELVDNPLVLEQLSKQSREFACRVYDCEKVAKKYIDLFLREA